MIRFFLVSLLILVPQDTPKTGGPFSVQLDNPSSRYWLVVPDDYDATRSVPMMVVLHGAGDSAENFIKVWRQASGGEYGYIVLAVKSSGQAWEESDAKRILSTMADVKKSYRVDPGRVFIVGYSSGGFMTSAFAVRNHTQFSVMTCIAGSRPQGGSDFKQASLHLPAFFCVGDLDPNKQIVSQTYENFKKGRFDTELNVVPKMEHSPLKPEAITWVMEKIRSRDQMPSRVYTRAKSALRERRNGDAIAAWRQLASLDETKSTKKFLDSAKKELAKLEKKARNELKKAKVKLDRKDAKSAVKILEKLIRDYSGLDDVIKEANELLEQAK